MRTIKEIFDSAKKSYDNYPDDFDWQTPKIPDLEIWDKIVIVMQEDYDFYNEEGLWEDESDILKWGEFPEGIILPNDWDMEEGSFEYFDSVICTKTPCPKEGTFYDYVPFHMIATNPELYKIIKV